MPITVHLLKAYLAGRRRGDIQKDYIRDSIIGAREVIIRSKKNGFSPYTNLPFDIKKLDQEKDRDLEDLYKPQNFLERICYNWGCPKNLEKCKDEDLHLN
ncbi:hypothetical protein CL622_01370 [archaeon]|nr:hypothetical protein [archaeon]|tara:strand:- start:1089 stop:1388 length:300 start_codon:yes stop_codon:yes gene_type:complete